MSCPVAGYKIDERAARAVAGFVVAATLLAEACGPWTARGLFAFLALDFGLRAFSLPRFSPLGRLASLILRALKVAPRSVDAGPKRFAARVGLLFSLSLLLTAGQAPRGLHLGIAGVLLLCAVLESAVGFCVGCALWTAWYVLLDRLRLGSRKES